MLHLSVLILLTVSLAVFLKKMLDKNFKERKANYERLNLEYEKGLQENLRLKKGNSDLEKSVDEIIALYDMTKDIRRILDEDKIFKLFKDYLEKYIKVGDACLLSADADLLQYKRHTILPLVIEKETIGYVVASDLREEQKDKFNILAQQFLAGFRGAHLFKKVQDLTTIDSLTQISNRRYFLDRFNEELEHSKKFKLKLSFLMADIDNFKDFNDNCGHLVGDAIIREVTGAIKENIRLIDLIGRYGGEELSVVLTETDKEHARFTAERIRQVIERRHLSFYNEELKVTISIGVSTFPDDAFDALSLIDKADHALYQAKQAGRNKVCAYEAIT
jgi:diguanylate cyclase (GGDEF)-like protein